MIELRTGPCNGMIVKCDWCGLGLLLDSKTDYKKCVNCNGEYKVPGNGLYLEGNVRIFQISPNYRWEIEYNGDLQILVKLCKLKTGWFGIKYWSNCVRGRLIELSKGFKGSEVGCRQGFYYIHTFDSDTFNLKETLIKWHEEHIEYQQRLFIKKQDLLKSINSLY